MAPQSVQLNERVAGTYGKLFDTIERGGDQCSIDQLQTLLAENTKNLSLGLDAFTPPSSSSRSKVTTGSSVSIDGKTIKLDQAEKDFIVKASEALQLNELTCATLWSTYKQEHGIQQISEPQQHSESFTAFYYDDRIYMLQSIASLLRVETQKDHAFVTIASDTIKQLVNDDFAERLLSQLKKLVRAAVPQQMSTADATEWAKQNLKEQRALLEVLFLVYYSRPCPPKFALSLLQEFEASSFGMQPTFGYILTGEGEELRDQVSQLCMLLSVQSLTLGRLRSSPTNDTLIRSPSIVAKMSQVARFLGSEQEHSVFLLAWSYVLSVIDSMLSDIDCPSEYQEVQSFIDGTVPVSEINLLTDRPVRVSRAVTTKNPTTGVTQRIPSIEMGPRAYRLFAGRAVRLDVFSTIGNILDGRMCGDDEPNGFGYRDVIKTELSTFLSTTEPWNLPDTSYSSLIQCASKLFQGQSDLTASFWTNSNDPMATLIAYSRSRFPLYFSDFAQLLSSLSGGRTDPKDIQSEESAKKVFDYLKTMPTLTAMLKDPASITTETDEDGTIRAKATRPIRIIGDFVVRGFTIASETTGFLVSPEGEKPIVQWNVEYSCWHLFVAVLAGYLRANRNGEETDIEELDKELSGKNLQVINGILDLIQQVLQVCPSLATSLVEHVELMPLVNGSNPYPSKILVALLCQILEYSCNVGSNNVPIIASTLRCLTSLLPYYRGEIWSYLEKAPILPWINANQGTASQLRFCSSIHVNPTCQIQHMVSNFECTTGRYTLLLSFLDLVTALVRDVQHKWWQSNNNSQQRQVEVLSLCLHYLMTDVFPSYAGWRYKYLSERFLIGSKVLTIFIEITQYFRDDQGSAVTLGTLRDRIMNVFLYNTAVYQVTPLLDTVRTGASIANNLYRVGRNKEAQRSEEMTELTFVFIKLLLQRRLESINTNGITHESTLERFMLERSTDGNSPDFLLRLMNHIDYRQNLQLSILATDIVTLLCRGLPAWKTTPNFVRHLGDKEQAQEIIKRYLNTAQDHTQNERLLASIWQMLTLLMETQPSLAILFLECSEYIMPSPKSAVKLLLEQQQQAPSTSQPVTNGNTESATRAAVDLLGHWEMLSIEKPTVLSNVLRFLATFWQTAFEHYALVQRTRSDSALWDALGKILLNPSQLDEPQRANLSLDLAEAMVSDGDEVVRRICCANVSKAFVMRIMAFEIHLTAGAERDNKSPLVDKLPAGLKSLLTKISDPNKLSFMQSSFVKNSFNPSLVQAMEASAKQLVGELGGTDISQLVSKVDVVGFGDNDAVGEPRQYGDCYLYDLRLANTRAQSALKYIAERNHVSIDQDEDTIVTPEVFAVRKAKESIKRFLTDLCAANHNWSVVDTQMIIFESFKVFMETCSTYVGELMWKSTPASGTLNAGTLFDFLSGMTQRAIEEQREDPVTLTHYSILISFIRDLTEDWIAANRQALTGTDRNQRRLLADKLFALLTTYSGLLRRDNYALMESISNRTPKAFHRPILEALLLPLRSLRKIYASVNDFKDTTRLQESIAQLLDITCETFRMLVYKAVSYSCDQGTTNAQNEECAKDVTVATGLLTELIHPNFHSGANNWLPVFRRHETIPMVLKLIRAGIDLNVSEVNRPLDANCNVVVSPYAENGFYLLLSLSSTSDTAAALVSDGVIELFSNNTLSPLLKQGALDMFLRFGDQTGFVERNPLHVIWCHMLCVMSNILRSLGNNSRVQLTDKVFQGTVALLQIYGSQVDRAFNLAIGVNDTLFGLPPSESLSSCLLEEVDRLSMIIYNLSKQLDRIMSYSASIFIAYKNSALALLQRFLYFFTHPAHMQAQLYPINDKERQLAELPSPSTETKNSPLMHLIAKKLFRIQRNILATLVILTQAEVIVTKTEDSWPFGNTIFVPNMRVMDAPSFGVLMEGVNAAIGFIKEYHESDSHATVRELLAIVEGSLVLLGTQAALCINKPEVEHEISREVLDDSLVEITTLLSKIYTTLSNTTISASLKDQKERTLVQITALKQFLGIRYFNV
ncbi:nucleoporin subcomplex protein binding to Pom34-domain-containing protein [Fennellomyces sp. T-0311]|nr:nucleoporin subcomplex protein binding to Pom34-domain-containing protein [Fennellomyces sp. T-0311]